MKYLVLCVTLNILFFINSVYSEVTIKAKYDDEKTMSVGFALKSKFDLSCNITEPVDEVKWLKDDQPFTKTSPKLEKGGTLSTIKITGAEEEDSGNYTCVAYKGGEIVGRDTVRAASHIAVKIPTNINVVEGESLRIHCLVAGNPPPQISWFYKNETYNKTITESEDRIILENDPKDHVNNTILVIEHIEMWDRGVFTCIGISPLTNEKKTMESMIRIKDKYAALWPFLGICAEVIVLCAIIFIYEKKRNKTELEESDTDQSPDQKNTPDHGKDSNLRHRQ